MTATANGTTPSTHKPIFRSDCPRTRPKQGVRDRPLSARGKRAADVWSSAAIDLQVFNAIESRMSLKIRLVDSDPVRARLLERTLAGAGSSNVARTGGGADLVEAVRRIAPILSSLTWRCPIAPRWRAYGPSPPAPRSRLSCSATRTTRISSRTPSLPALLLQSFVGLRLRHEGDRRLGDCAFPAPCARRKGTLRRHGRSSRGGGSSSAPRRSWWPSAD